MRFSDRIFFIITEFFGQVNQFLALSLFMALIFGADDHNFAVSLDDLALVAHRFYGRSDFHDMLPLDIIRFGCVGSRTPGEPSRSC